MWGQQAVSVEKEVAGEETDTLSATTSHAVGYSSRGGGPVTRRPLPTNTTNCIFHNTGRAAHMMQLTLRTATSTEWTPRHIHCTSPQIIDRKTNAVEQQSTPALPQSEDNMVSAPVTASTSALFSHRMPPSVQRSYKTKINFH